MIITTDHIRRFPFAVNPARITEELEELIAEDMKQATRREGNFPAMPRLVNNEADVQLARAKLQELIASLPPCTIGMEACSGAHHWAREFAKFGHTVRLMAPKFVIP
jgi:transposase